MITSWYLFSKPHPTTYHSNIGVGSPKKATECGLSTLGSDVVTVHMGNVSPLSYISKLCGPLPRGKMHELLFFEPDQKNIPPVNVGNGARLATNSKDSDQRSESMRRLCLQVSPTQSSGSLSNGLVLSKCDS